MGRPRKPERDQALQQYLDSDGDISTKELAMAAWHSRTDLPKELTDISITYEMIEALRIGGKGGQA